MSEPSQQDKLAETVRRSLVALDEAAPGRDRMRAAVEASRAAAIHASFMGDVTGHGFIRAARAGGVPIVVDTRVFQDAVPMPASAEELDRVQRAAAEDDARGVNDGGRA